MKSKVMEFAAFAMLVLGTNLLSYALGPSAAFAYYVFGTGFMVVWRTRYLEESR